MPRWLSDLVPEFIHDANVLKCPFVERTGNLKKYRDQYVSVPVFGDSAACSYAYEFCTEPIPAIPGMTCRSYKRSQMELIGFGVPIVRCFAHRPVLNVGFDGNIYESPGEWEDNFVTDAQHASLFHNVPLLTNRSQNQLVMKVIRPAASEPSLGGSIELSKSFNALLLHLSQLDHSGKVLTTYPPEGIQTIGPARFDIRGVVHLTGRNFPISFPEKVERIEVNRKCSSIHFLHGTLFETTPGTKIASFIIKSTGGKTDEVPIVYGKDVKTRWFDRGEPGALANPKPAWVSPPEQIGTTGKSLRLYVTSWSNQNPDSGIQSIDFVSHMTDSAPFLVAITVE